MPASVNYDTKMQAQINALSNTTTKLLLHACCAPCSSAVLERLSPYFDITVLFYNPNIAPAAEYHKRVNTMHQLLRTLPLPRPVSLEVADYQPAAYQTAVAGLEQAPEGGARCQVCIRQRLLYTQQWAKAEGFPFFTTTLSISPHKSAPLINTLGESLSSPQTTYLYADFKKQNGYLRSLQLSRQLSLYRQSYCGCLYAKP